MPSFLTLFDSHVAELEAALPPEATPDSAAEAMRGFLDRLHDHYVAANPLGEAEAVAARAGIEILQAAAQVIVSASRSEIWQQAGPGGMPGESRKRHLVWTRVLFAALAIGLTAYFALVLWSYQRWNELILLGAAAGAEIVRVVLAFFASRRSRKAERQKVAEVRSRATIHVDRQALVRRLSHAVGALDKLVQDAGRLRPSIASAGPVVEDPAFTELLQDLMEARETADGEYAVRVLRSLRSTLERHGIQVISFDGANRQLFEFQPSLQPAGGDQTLRPALVQEGRLLRRGLVAEAKHVR
jgi:hypothetical protein